jgi:hypothetical protein
MYLATREAAALALADPREITRSNPDIIVYDPTSGRPRPWKEVPRFNEHSFVLPLRPEKMIAFWTSETHEIRYAFSGDDGTSWSPAELLTQNGAWQVPILSPSGKLYVCYTDGAINGGFNWVTSTDDGKTWSAPIQRKFARSQIDHPDESVEPRWISPTVPFGDANNVGRASPDELMTCRFDERHAVAAYVDSYAVWLHVEQAGVAVADVFDDLE